MNMENNGGLFGCRPILCVQNVARSIEYYVAVLGFQLGWSWSDGDHRFLQGEEDGTPTFALVGRGVQIMLSQNSQGVSGMWLHLDVHTAQQLDGLYEEWTSKAAKIIEPPSLRPWGMYEMRVQDLDGHTLRVSSPPSVV